jgi:hypothetical protein
MLLLPVLALAAAQPGFNSQAAIRSLSPLIDPLENCYRESGPLPKVGSTITLAVIVGPTGEHFEHRPSVVETTANAPELERCLVTRLEGLKPRFPGAPDLTRTLVLIQLTLEPGEPPSLDAGIETRAAPPLESSKQIFASWTVADWWDVGGVTMYLMTLCLIVELLLGALACALALTRRGRAAVVLAGLCWGLSSATAAIGMFGFFQSKAVTGIVASHLSPDDKERMCLAGVAEAQVPLRFGTAAAVPGLLLGALAVVRTLTQRSNRHV